MGRKNSTAICQTISALGYRVGIKEPDRAVVVEGRDKGSAAHASLVVAGDGFDA